MEQVNEAQGGRRGLGLWRAMPFVGAAVAVFSNCVHDWGATGRSADEASPVFFAVLLAIFFDAYGPYGQAKRAGDLSPEAEARRTRSTLAGLYAALLASLAGALIFSAAEWLPIHPPATGEDWRLVAYDIAALALYVRIFHELWTTRRGRLGD